MEACARREFLAETAYVLGDIWHLLDFVDDQDPGLPASHVTVYWGWYDGRQACECREGQALAFIRRDAVETCAVPPYLLGVWDRALAAARASGGVATCVK